MGTLMGGSHTWFVASVAIWQGKLASDGSISISKTRHWEMCINATQVRIHIVTSVRREGDSLLLLPSPPEMKRKAAAFASATLTNVGLNHLRAQWVPLLPPQSVSTAVSGN